MALLNSCCRCCTLKTGTIFSGVVGIIFSIILLIVILTDQNVEFKTIIIDALPQWVVRLILAINLVFTVVICILLIIGAIKRNVLLMVPWVVLGIMLVIGLFVSILYTSIVFYIDGDTFNGTVWLVFGFIAILIYLYMWAVVFSFFQIVREESARGMYDKPPFQRYPQNA